MDEEPDGNSMLTEIERLNEVNRQKQELLEIMEFHLRWGRFINECYKCQRDLERLAKGDFRPEMSRRLDIIQTVLDAEG